MLFPQDDFNIRDQNLTTKNGVSLTLFPAMSSSIYGLELQRAPDNNGSPGIWITIATIPATSLSTNGTPFFDQLGVNGQILWYQDRHIDQNGNTSAWNTAVSAIAKRYVVNAQGVPIGTGVIDLADPGNLNVDGDHINRSAGSTTKIGPVITYIDDSGRLGSGMQDATGRNVLGYFHTGSNTADAINDGSSKRVPTLNEATGGGLGYTTLDSTGVKDGKLIRSRGWDDGSWAVVARSNDGLTLNPSVQSNAGHTVDGMFHTGSHTIDVIADGSTYAKVHTNALSGNDIDFSKSAFQNKTVDWVSDGTGYVRTPQQSGGDNLAENSNFELTLVNGAIPGWNPSNAIITLDSGSNVFRGTKSLKVSASGQYGAALSVRKWKVRPGETYFVSGAVRCAGANDQADIQLMYLDVTGSYQAAAQAQTSLGQTSWVGIQALGLVPASASYAQLSLQNNNAGGGVVWFDDIYVCRVKSATNEVMRGSVDLATVVQHLQDTGHLASNIQDGGGRLVQGMFHTGSNTLDNVNDGSTYYKTTANQRDGGGRGYNTIDSGGQVYLQGTGTNSSQTVNIGTQSTAASIQRTFRVPYGSFKPNNSNTVSYAISGGQLRPNTTNTLITYVADINLPPGSTIIQTNLRVYKNASGDSAIGRLMRTSDGSTTTLATCTLSATGAWTTVTVSSLSEAVNTSYAYIFEVDLDATVSVTDARLSYFEVIYTVNNLSTGL